MVSNEAGEPYSPAVLSRYRQDTVKAAGVRHIKLHAARHTCATLMHLSAVPVAVIAAWIGHKDASLTMPLCGHPRDEALRRLVTFNRNLGSRFEALSSKLSSKSQHGRLQTHGKRL